MTDEPEIPKTSDTIIASAQADTTPGALSEASVTDKPGGGGALFDADGNPIAQAPEASDLDLQQSAAPAMALGTQVDPRVLDNEKFIQGSQWPVFSKTDEPNPIGAPDSDLRSDVEALKADLLYLRSLHGWPVEEGNKLKAYYHDGLKKLGIGE